MEEIKNLPLEEITKREFYDGKIKRGDWVALKNRDGMALIIGYLTGVYKSDAYLKMKTVYPVQKRGREYADDYDNFYKVLDKLEKSDVQNMIDVALDMKDEAMFNHYTEILKAMK